MGKYGFNEKEIVKTITDMIDKDGFHKEVVTYGKPIPISSGIESGTFTETNRTNPDLYDVVIITNNVPAESRIAVLPKATNEDYDFEIGDTFGPDGYVIDAHMTINDINTVISIHQNMPPEGIDAVFYQVYAISHDVDPIVLDRAKTGVQFGK